VTGKPDRQVCDDCEQIFQNGFPVTVVPEGVSGKPAEKIGQQLSDLTAEAEVPPVTKAAATRAKKARKPKVGKAEGAKTINLNPDELARGKKSDEEDARQKYLKSVSADASFVVGTLKGFAALCKTADEAMEARDAYFSEKIKNPEFAKRIQNIRDFASTKKNNEVLTIEGREYRSVKAFFKAELGKTYEYIRKLGERGKLGVAARLLEALPQPEATKEQKQPAEKTKADDEFKLITDAFEKRATRYEKEFNEKTITGPVWVNLLQDEKKRSTHPDWVAKVDATIHHAKEVIAATPTNTEVAEIIDEQAENSDEQPMPDVTVTTPNITDKYLPRLEAIFGKDQVKIEDCHDRKFGYRIVRYHRAKVTFLIDLPDLDRFIAKQDELYVVATPKMVETNSGKL
jgi:hypothetical protein